MTWYVSYDKLDSKQIYIRDGIVRSLDRSHWVQGYAGTGKTLILVHAMERVAADEPDASLCFITYTHALKDMVVSGLHGSVVKRIKIKTHTQFLYDRSRYDYVFLDEVQDITPPDIEQIRKLSGSLIIAGDPEQSIYADGASEPQILSDLKPQTWFLELIFRLTPLLRKVAMVILPTSKIVEGPMANTSANVTIRMGAFGDEGTEAGWVWDEASKRARPGEPSVILFPTHNALASFSFELARQLCLDVPPSAKARDRRAHDYGPFNEFWQENGIKLQYLGNGQGSFAIGDQHPIVYVMTFASAKGLDFENVFIPGMHQNAYFVNPYAMADRPGLDRRLLFVAVTRSRKNLFITYAGNRPHRFIANLPQDAAVPVRPTVRANNNDEDLF